MKYKRFHNKEDGVFAAICDLCDDGLLSEIEELEWGILELWFALNLKVPTKFARVKKPLYRAEKIAICWFKESAVDHISRMRKIVEIVRNHGIEVDEIETEKPGYITYKDEFQIAAIPFKDTFRK